MATLDIEQRAWDRDKDYDRRVEACRLIEALALQKYVEPDERIDPIRIVEYFFNVSTKHRSEGNSFFATKGRSIRQGAKMKGRT